jgi:hypothetical protein
VDKTPLPEKSPAISERSIRGRLGPGGSKAGREAGAGESPPRARAISSQLARPDAADFFRRKNSTKDLQRLGFTSCLSLLFGGPWRSLVARLHGVQEAESSNLSGPTISETLILSHFHNEVVFSFLTPARTETTKNGQNPSTLARRHRTGKRLAGEW